MLSRCTGTLYSGAESCEDSYSSLAARSKLIDSSQGSSSSGSCSHLHTESPKISKPATISLVLDLNERVAIALNKLDASSMETMHFREPWGPLIVSSLRSNATAQGPRSSLIRIISWTRYLTSI